MICTIPRRQEICIFKTRLLWSNTILLLKLQNWNVRAITPRPQLNTSTQFACAHTAPNSVLMWTSTTRVFHFDKSVHSTNYFPFTELQYCIRRSNIYAYERGQLKNLMCFALSLTVDLVWVVGTAFGVPSLFLHPLTLACSLSFSSLSTTVYAHELKSFEMFLIKRIIVEGRKRCEMFEWLSSIFALLFLRLIGTFNATERRKTNDGKQNWNWAVT